LANISGKCRVDRYTKEQIGGGLKKYIDSTWPSYGKPQKKRSLF